MNLAGRVRRNMWTKIKLGTATYYQKLAFFLLRVVSVMTFWGGGGCVVASLGPPPFDGPGRLRDPRRRSKPLSAWSPRGHQAVTSGSIMPTEHHEAARDEEERRQRVMTITEFDARES